MPVYAYECRTCWRTAERVLPMGSRDDAQVCDCGAPLTRVATTAAFRLPGGNPRINYADQFTADMLGVPVGEVSRSGLHTPKGKP